MIPISAVSTGTHTYFEKKTDSYYACILITIVGNIWGRLLYNFKKEITNNHYKLQILSDLNRKVLPSKIVSLSYIDYSGNVHFFTKTLHSLSEEKMNRFFENLILMIKSENG